MKKTGIVAMVVMMACLVMCGCASEREKVGFGENGTLTGTEELPDLMERLELSDYLAYAALNNPGLKAAFEHWRAAIEEVPQAKSLPDPKITYGNFIKGVETKVGPQRQKFGIMQSFPWFGTLKARTELAGAKAKAAMKQYQAVKLKLFWQVKASFAEYAYLAEAIGITRENLQLLQHFEEVARSKYITNIGTHPDLLHAQIQLANMENVLETLEAFREPVVARLNAALNRPPTAHLAWPERGEFREVHFDISDVMALLIAKNPELGSLEWEIEAAKKKIELAKKRFYPDIGTGIEWIRSGGKDPVILLFSMVLPLWRESYKAGERQAQAEMREVTYQKLDIQNTILAKAVEVLYDYEVAVREIHLYADTLIPKAEELVRTSEIAYKVGTMDFLSLIESQQMLLRYQLGYERALADYQQKLAELEMLAGGELGEAASSEEQKENN